MNWALKGKQILLIITSNVGEITAGRGKMVNEGTELCKKTSTFGRGW